MHNQKTSIRKRDRYFLRLVKKGYFKVFKDGTVLNTKTQNTSWTVNGGYRKVSHKGEIILLHRLVWLALKDLIPHGMVVNIKTVKSLTAK